MTEYYVDAKFVLVMPPATGDCTLVVAFFVKPKDCVVTEGMGCF